MQFNKSIINYSYIEKEIPGDNCTVIPVIIDDNRYFFKVLNKSMLDKVLLEISVVDYLNDKGILVPSYYSKDNKKVFSYEESIYYGSKEVKGVKASNIVTYKALESIVENIAKMHKEISNYPIENITCLEKNNDSDRLRKFYKEHKEFLIENNLIEYVENLLVKNTSTNRFYIIHSDLNFNNIFIDNGEFSSFIDFTDIKLGYLEDDLGKLWQNILYLENINSNELNKLKKIYENVSNQHIDENSLTTSIVYRIIYRYFCAVDNKENYESNYLDKTKKIIRKVISKEV